MNLLKFHLHFRYGSEMATKRKNVQNGNEKTSQGKKTQVESNPEEIFQQDNGGNTNERISCKCNKLWEQNRLLAHIKRDSNCGSKYTDLGYSGEDRACRSPVVPVEERMCPS